MASDSTVPSWQYVNNDSNFVFAQQAPVHVPRAWERAPQPSHVARHKGRKVWKRPEARAKDDVGRHETPPIDEERNPLRDVSSNTPRPVKRLRVKDGLATGGHNEGGGFANYFATLRDGAIGTPKRKGVVPDLEKPQGPMEDMEGPETTPQKLGQILEDPMPLPTIEIAKNEIAEAQVAEAQVAEEQVAEDHVAEDHVAENHVAEDHVAEDPLNAPESPAQADVRNLLETSNSPEANVENEAFPILDEGVSMGKDVAQHKKSQTANIDSQSILANIEIAEEVDARETIVDTPMPEETVEPIPSPQVFKVTEEIGSPGITLDTTRPQKSPEPTHSPVKFPAKQNAEARDSNANSPFLRERTPISMARQVYAQNLLKANIESPQGLNSPQIGTTLLKRESLRSKGSPRKRGSARKDSSPQKSHGLKKRDTLQEREILQQFNAASSPTHATVTTDSLHEAGSTSPSKDPPRQSMVTECGNQKVTTSPESRRNELAAVISADTPAGEVPVDQTILKDKDIARTIEAIEVCQNPNDGAPDAGFNDASLSADANGNIDQTNEIIATSEVQEPVQSVTTVSESLDVSTRKTRSGARISDDTSMLKDFLNRAQAKKAAKNVPLLSAEVPNLQTSPMRRSPRKALEPHSGEIGSPQKKKKSTKGPSTPPRKVLAEENDSSDDQETICGPASFRRSMRTRLPAPSKTPPGAPTFIPVRRGESSDQIVLQKSQAQEMAIVTRANTRRNKGQSKPPALALQELPPESPVKLTSKERADYAKKVAWAEKLASFQESKDAPEEPEEQQRPKVRRMRGLGAVNGTPAKKSTAMAPSSNGTPAPKRRSKTR